MWAQQGIVAGFAGGVVQEKAQACTDGHSSRRMASKAAV
jgi:hypothetical protein